MMSVLHLCVSPFLSSSSLLCYSFTFLFSGLVCWSLAVYIFNLFPACLSSPQPRSVCGDVMGRNWQWVTNWLGFPSPHVFLSIQTVWAAFGSQFWKSRGGFGWLSMMQSCLLCLSVFLLCEVCLCYMNKRIVLTWIFSPEKFILLIWTRQGLSLSLFFLLKTTDMMDIYHVIIVFKLFFNA